MDERFKRMNRNEEKWLVANFNLLRDLAKFFKEHYIGKHVISESEGLKVTVKMVKSNFMHLCGIWYRFGAKKFFNNLLEGKVKIQYVFVKKDGLTSQKMEVMSDLYKLLSNGI